MRQDLRGQVQHQLSTGIDLTRWVGSIGLAVAVGIAYFAAARLSLALLANPEGVAVFWPAAGVSAGALIALGSRARWPVVVGTTAATIVANLSGDRNLWSAVLFALCNAGEAVLTAWLIGHYFGSDFRLNKLRNVLGLAAAAIIGTAISGIGGAIVFKLLHSTTTPILTTWQHWFASDGLGIITVAPLLIELVSASRDRPPLSEFVEGALAVAALALVSGLAIFLRSELLATVGPVAVLFAPLLWLAARCRPVFAAAAAFIVSLSIVWTTTFGIGYFGNPGLSTAERVRAAQVSILLVTIGASVLAALFLPRSGTKGGWPKQLCTPAKHNAISSKPRDSPHSAVSSQGLHTRSIVQSASALPWPRRSRTAARNSPTRSSQAQCAVPCSPSSLMVVATLQTNSSRISSAPES